MFSRFPASERGGNLCSFVFESSFHLRLVSDDWYSRTQELLGKSVVLTDWVEKEAKRQRKEKKSEKKKKKHKKHKKEGK